MPEDRLTLAEAAARRRGMTAGEAEEPEQEPERKPPPSKSDAKKAPMPIEPERVDPGQRAEDIDPNDAERVLHRVRQLIKDNDDPAFFQISVSPEEKKKQREKFPALVTQAARDMDVMLSREAVEPLSRKVFNTILGFGPLEPLIEREDITDILINGPDKIWIDTDEGFKRAKDIRFRDKDHIVQIAKRIANGVGRDVNLSSPICDARLRDGSRVVITLEPPAVGSPSIVIRKFRSRRFTFEDLVKNFTMNQQVADFLMSAVRARSNFAFVGPMSSGKTTMLGVCINYMDPLKDRACVVEDTAELTIDPGLNVERTERRPPTTEGGSEISIRELVQASLRKDAKRLVVGEVRGKEAIDLISAMSSGSYGSMCTVHGNDALNGLSKLELYSSFGSENIAPRYLRQLLVEAVNLVVCMAERTVLVEVDGVNKEMKQRKILQVAEPVGVDPENDEIMIQDIFRYRWTKEGETWEQVGYISGTLENKFDYWDTPVRGLDKRVGE